MAAFNWLPIFPANAPPFLFFAEDISNLLSEANVRDVKSKTTTTMNGKTELEVLQVAASVSNFSNGKRMPDVHNEVELECAEKLKAGDWVIEQASDVAAMEGYGDEFGMKYVGQQVDTKAAEIEVGVEKADVAEDKKELEHLATIEQQVAVSKEKPDNEKDHFTCKNNNVLDEKPSDCPEVLDEKPGQVDNLVKYGSRIVISKENGRNKVHPVGRDGYSGIAEEKYLGREGLLEEFGNCEQSKRCFDNSKVLEKGLENEMFLTKPRDGQYPAKHFRTEGHIWNQYNTGEHLKERCGTEEQHGDYFDKEEYVEKYRGTEELHVDNSYGTEEQFTEKFSTKEHKRDLCGTEEDLADNHNSGEYLRGGHGTEEDLGDNLGCEGYLKNDCGTEVDLVHNQNSEERLRDNYGLEEHIGDHHGGEEHLRERHINNPVVFRDQTKDSDTKLVTIGFLRDSGNSNGSSCSSYEDTESESCDDEISHDQKKISISGEDLERALDAYLEANVSRKMETVEHHLEKTQRSNEETRTWIKSSRASQPEGNLSAPREKAFFSSVSKQPRRQSMTAESGRSQHLKQRMQHDHDAKEHQNKEIQYEYEHDVTASGRMYDVNKQRRRILSNGNAVPEGFRENGQDSENNFYGASADDVTAYLSALPDHWKQNWYKAYERQTKLISAYTELYRHAFH